MGAELVIHGGELRNPYGTVAQQAYVVRHHASGQARHTQLITQVTAAYLPSKVSNDGAGPADQFLTAQFHPQRPSFIGRQPTRHLVHHDRRSWAASAPALASDATTGSPD